MGKKDKLKLEFIGMNADNVTGSMTLISDKNLSILLESGLYQSNDIVGDYKFGFKTDAKRVVDTGKGLSLEVVKKISEYKNEPEWMREFRIKAYEKFVSMPLPSFGPDLSFLDFNDYTYYIKSSEKVEKSWGCFVSTPPKTLPFIHRGDMCLARHKGRKKTLALPNRPKPLGVVRSLTDEFREWGTGNWEWEGRAPARPRGMGNGSFRRGRAWEGRAPARP